MEKYDYRRVVTDDVKDWIVNEADFVDNKIIPGRDDDLYNYIYDELFYEDSVTGNGTYGYDTEDNCADYLKGNFDILKQAAQEFDFHNNISEIIKYYERNWLARYFDCTIRCYLLSECIYQAVDELIEEGFFIREGE